MKANSRRRVLISSIAMLLVALVALSTATFAWFTTNPTATASGLELKATAAKGLVIQTGTHGTADADFWGHTDYLNYDSATQKSSTDAISLSATSFDLTDDFTTGYTVDAAADDSYKAAANATVTEAASNAYYSEIIKCKLTGADDENATDTVVITSVGLTNNSKKMSNAIRVALSYTYNNTTTQLGVYAPAAANNCYLTNTGTYSAVLSDSDAETEGNQGTAIPAITSISNKDAGTVDVNGTGYLTVTVYLDGEDSTCNTNNIEFAELVEALTINLKLKSAI